MKEIRNDITNALQALYQPAEIECFIRLILEHLFAMPYHRILAEKELPVTAEKQEQSRAITQRLSRSEPIQYILGYADFYGLSFHVTPATLIPRPETEELVEKILTDHPKQSGTSLLDIGTGSGCIALTLAKHLPTSTVTGVDISPLALEVAEENARRHTINNLNFRQVDILATNAEQLLPEAPFDYIVSNPPYIMEKEKVTMEKNVLTYEPEKALFVPDNNPLLFYRRIAQLGHLLLKPSGTLYFEINARCGEAMKEMMTKEGYTQVELFRDLSGNDRIIKARK